MTTPADSAGTPNMADLGEGWVNILEGSRRLGISAKTLRRRIKAGEVEARLVHDPAIGGDRWMIQAEEPAPKPEILSMEVVAKLEEAWQRVADLSARAEVAERVLEFERERRERAEAEAEQLRAELAARHAPIVANVSQPAVSDRRRWWQRRP